MDNSQATNWQEKLKTWLAHNFTWLVILEIVVIGGGGYFFFIKQEMAVRRLVSPEARQLKEEALADYQLLLRRYQEIAREYQAVSESERERLSLALPATFQLPELLYNLQAIVKEAGLTLESVNISQVTVKEERGKSNQSVIPGLAKVSLRVTLANSGYQSLKAFLRLTERSLRLLDVQDLSFDPTKQQFSLRLQSYYLPD